MRTKTKAAPPIQTRRSVSFLGFNRDMNAAGLSLVRNCPVIELKVLVRRNGEVTVTGNKLQLE